jgi:hypothetical protein
MDFLWQSPSPKRASRRACPATALVERLERRTLLSVQVGLVPSNNQPPTAGQQFNGQVATFLPADVGGPASDYQATINWGGGLTVATPGTISLNGQGVYVVTGSNTYTQPGIYTVTVQVTGSGTPASASGIGSADVQDATVTTFPVTVNPVRGTAFSGIVASFQSANPYATTNDFAATIDWGDGTPTVPGTISVSSSSFDVVGQHTYQNDSPIPIPITVTITSKPTQLVVGSVTSFANVTDTPISVYPVNFTGTVNQSVMGVTVATFLDPYPTDTNAQFSSTIDWGDGTTSIGTIGPGSNGVFTVTGIKPGNYTAAGTYTVNTQVVRISTNQAVSASGQAVIKAAPTVLTPSPVLLVNPVNEQLNNVTVGTFTDSNPKASTVTPVAEISWGNGQTSPGAVTYDSATGVFTVTGSILYTTPGTYPVTVMVNDTLGDSTTINSQAIATSPVLTPVGALVTATAGIALPASTVVGSFFDSNTSTPAANFTAMISWGDGNVSVGTVSPVSGTPGLFSVSGTNLYATKGSYTISIAVQDNLGNPATIKSTADVAAPVLTPKGTVLNFIAGVPTSGLVTVGSFYDTNPNAAATGFTATIKWGDGNISSGTVTESSTTPGLFLVSGTNLYTTANPYTISIQVQDSTGASTTITSEAIVSATNVYSFAGVLADVVGNGPHSASGFTNTDRPTFTGTAAPYATVQLYARHFNTDAELPLGESVANGNGQWTLTTGPLAVGTYIVTATFTTPGGYPSNMITLTNTNGTDLVYIDLTPRLVRWLAHGKKSVPHPRRIPHPKMPKPAVAGHHIA